MRTIGKFLLYVPDRLMSLSSDYSNRQNIVLPCMLLICLGILSFLFGLGYGLLLQSGGGFFAPTNLFTFAVMITIPAIIFGGPALLVYYPIALFCYKKGFSAKMFILIAAGVGLIAGMLTSALLWGSLTGEPKLFDSFFTILMTISGTIMGTIIYPAMQRYLEKPKPKK